MNDHHSLLGPYVTDALDDDERDSFELHLESCSDCRGEALDLQETMAQVSALQEAAPPPALRSSILSMISSTPMLPVQEPAAVRDTPETAPTPSHDEAPSNVVKPDFSRSRRPVTTWLAAAAAVIAVTLGGVTVWQQSELQSIQSADAQRADLLAAPDLKVAPATLDDGGELTYLVSQQRGEALMASADLPDPGNDRSWQVWVMHDGTPRSGAVVDAGGRVQTWISDVAGGEALAITNEPRGGSPAPTTDDIQAAVEF